MLYLMILHLNLLKLLEENDAIPLFTLVASSPLTIIFEPDIDVFIPSPPKIENFSSST